MSMHAREAIGAVQCAFQHATQRGPFDHPLVPDCPGMIAEDPVHTATRGVNSARPSNAGNSPTHFPSEPSGRS